MHFIIYLLWPVWHPGYGRADNGFVSQANQGVSFKGHEEDSYR
jgi:hypothetical protein